MAIPDMVLIVDVVNFSSEKQVKTKALEKTKNHDLGSTAGTFF